MKIAGSIGRSRKRRWWKLAAGGGPEGGDETGRRTSSSCADFLFVKDTRLLAVSI